MQKQNLNKFRSPFRGAVIFFIAILSLYSCVQKIETPSLLEEGVPLAMANYRRDQLQDIYYNLEFAIPQEKENPIDARLEIKLRVQDLTHPVYLDFKEETKTIQSVIVNNDTVPIVHKKEHLIIEPKDLIIGENKVEVDFQAGELSLNRNTDYLYTLLVPDRARTLFPCFDQPNLKAHYKLTVRAPKEWKVLAGAVLASKEEEDEFTTHIFEQSDKMSTYLFSFAAGKFDTITSAQGDTRTSMKMLYRETNTSKIEASTTPIFNLHQSSLDFLEQYTAYDFPFQKFDLVTIPGFQYGGMEHTGAIQYREASLFLDSSATITRELARAKLIAHETSHMWFGNLVTMQWFNDVWMKEVFANFMADKIVNPVFTAVNHDLQFLTSHYPRAYSTDRTRGSNPIRQDLTNLKNAGSLYGSIIYNKAPIMMRQLELTLGEAAFKAGIQEYINTYANGNADWNGLVSILDRKTDLDLEKWSDIWVNSSGRPVFNAEVDYSRTNKITKFTITQNAEDGSDKYWPQSFAISLVYPDDTKTVIVKSSAKTEEINEVIGFSKPLYILYNSNGFGYGVFPTAPIELANTQFIKNEVARAHSYLNAYENVLNNNISLPIVFENIQKGLGTEPNELILRLLANQTSNLYWNYLLPEERQHYQAKIERVVWERLKASAPKNIKKTLFGIYTDIAHSQEGIRGLYQIWKKEMMIENLILNEDDYTSLAQQLMLYGHDESDLILEKAKQQISNPDKLERFVFMEKALSHDVSVRNTFFESFKDLNHRAKESWVLAAASYIHHPLRQADAVETLGLSLDLLEEIQRTGDIFFPKGWLDNTVGRYTSKEAYTMVVAYMNNHPDLDKNLRRKLLQATDKLYRRQSE